MDRFVRFDGNPIIVPNPELAWKAKATYNPAAIFLDGKVHIIYRAQANDGSSVLGYATSRDGIHIDENLDYPIYTPREPFEQMTKPQWNSGCEDPRITQIGERLYMAYTAYDGTNPPGVALTSISVNDFLSRNWFWEDPKLISPPTVEDKDACIFKRVKGEGYIALHRLGKSIWIDFLDNIDFQKSEFLSGSILAEPRIDMWDNLKIGIAAPPIETDIGWILLYHGYSEPEFIYKIGAILLDYDDPRKVLARTLNPLLSPEKPYETTGQIPNIVYGCGSVVMNNTVYLYYGGADSVVGVATIPLQNLINVLMQNKY
jgi:predicted GH43/DUF377 family glycosyl hydrolase